VPEPSTRGKAGAWLIPDPAVKLRARARSSPAAAGPAARLGRFADQDARSHRPHEVTDKPPSLSGCPAPCSRRAPDSGEAPRWASQFPSRGFMPRM